MSVRVDLQRGTCDGCGAAGQIALISMGARYDWKSSRSVRTCASCLDRARRYRERCFAEGLTGMEDA